MPNIKSAKKRVKVAATKTARNKAYKSSLRTSIKKALISISSPAADREKQVRLALKHIDKAASKGILHKNTAARKKSALALKLNSTLA
ncbi:MAG: 30S ribosomal protein S20 [Lactobacillales bacterium]|nr:30S ribosomal protein S20 [Lactobacillales bacterium]